MAQQKSLLKISLKKTIRLLIIGKTSSPRKPSWVCNRVAIGRVGVPCEACRHRNVETNTCIL